MIYNDEEINLDRVGSHHGYSLRNIFSDPEELRYQVSLAKDPEDLAERVLHNTDSRLKTAELKYDYPTRIVLLVTTIDDKYYLTVRKFKPTTSRSAEIKNISWFTVFLKEEVLSRLREHFNMPDVSEDNIKTIVDDLFDRNDVLNYDAIDEEIKETLFKLKNEKED